MAKTYEEKCTELDQKIRRLQGEKRKLARQQKQTERKHRDHVMIVIGATFCTHYSEAERERVLSMTDEEIAKWVHSKFKN